MKTVDEAHIDENTRMIDFLTDIIKANRLHEAYCPAFGTAKGDFANMFSGMLEKQCDCWLDKDNRTEEGRAVGVYHIETKTLLQDAFYVNRFYAREHILETYPDLSADPKSDNYWANTYYIVEVTVGPAPETTESTE